MTKILLVEDDKSLREIYGVRLLAEGYDIVSAGDGEEALAMAIKDRPDLIVSDVMMPKISGFDMLDILRSTTETKNIKVIMMTALSSEDQRQRGVSLGADRYLVKSQVGIEDVVRTVHEVLGDAPVSGSATSVTAATTPHTAAVSNPPQPAAPIAPGPGAQGPAPAAPAAPQPAPVAAPQPAAPQPATHPVAAPIAPGPGAQGPAPAAPAAPQPAPVAAPQPAAPEPSLPQPTAPFSTPRPANLADRVIQPLGSDNSSPSIDFSNMMNKELSADAPQAAPQPAPAAPSGMNFEETPRPGPQLQAPAAPTPPTPPNPGV